MVRCERNRTDRRKKRAQTDQMPSPAVPGSTSTLFQQWCAADRAASELERQILKSSMRAIDALEPVPSREQHDEAHALRAKARHLFLLMMKEMEANSDAARLSAESAKAAASRLFLQARRRIFR